MTEITPWVPVVVSAIGSLGVGALVGAFGSDKLRERAERRREKKEWHGLLRLLQFEVWRNSIVSELLREHLEDIPNGTYGSLEIEVWKEVRVRLAALMPEEDFETVHDYYMTLDRFLVLLNACRAARDTKEEARWREKALDYLATAVQRQESRAINVIWKYTPVTSAEGQDRAEPRS